MPALAVAAGLFLTERVLVGLVGTPLSQLRLLCSLGHAPSDPVTPALAILSFMAEALVAYVLVVLALRSFSLLPGSAGRVAGRVGCALSPRVVRCLLDVLVGGALLAQMTLVTASGTPGGHGLHPNSMVAVGSPASIEAPGSALGRSLASPSASVPRAQAMVAFAAPSTTGLSMAGPPVAGSLVARLEAAGSEAAGSQVAGSAVAGSSLADSSLPPALASAALASAAIVSPPLPIESSPVRSFLADGIAPAEARPALRRSAVPLPPWLGGGPSKAAPRYTVEAGDTLWDIAAAHLAPADRSSSHVHRYWQQIYRANRSALGADPDLIHPGTRLNVPPFQDDHR